MTAPDLPVPAASQGGLLVSVIMPTYNRARLLPRALRSVAAQTHRPLELLVIDDGSTDGTRSVVESTPMSDVQVRYLFQSNQGCAAARNLGLREARGLGLALLDSDDEWLPCAVQSLVERMIACDVELVYSPSVEVRSNGLEQVNPPPAAERPERLAAEHFFSTNVRPGSFLFSRRALELAGPFDEQMRFNEDSDFFQRLALQCRAAYSPTPSLKHFHHEANKSNDRVEIFRALLKSSERILLEHPRFAAQLGADGSARIRQIRIQLAEALTLEGRYEEAGAIAAELEGTLPLKIRRSIRTRNNLWMRIEQALRFLLRSIRHTALRALQALQGRGRHCP
jgi:glycosyltransferase involved in cell wall biosynthesis